MAEVECSECGAAMTINFETKLHRCAVPVVLKGIEVRRCPACGVEDVVYPRPALLQKRIAETFAVARGRLGPGELKYLRHYLGLSSVQLAETFGVAPETVSRWESKTKPQRMGSTAEKLLRVLVLGSVSVEQLRTMASSTDVLVPHIELRFDEGSTTWVAPSEATESYRRRRADDDVAQPAR